MTDAYIILQKLREQKMTAIEGLKYLMNYTQSVISLLTYKTIWQEAHKNTD